MNRTVRDVIGLLLIGLPYGLVAWAFVQFIDGSRKEFWMAVIFLFAARLFFLILEGLTNVVWWRVAGKRVSVQRNLERLRDCRFPKRRDNQEHVTAYLYRLAELSKLSDADRVWKAAIEIQCTLENAKEVGFWTGRRVEQAWEDALEEYSPRLKAPDWGANSW